MRKRGIYKINLLGLKKIKNVLFVKLNIECEFCQRNNDKYFNLYIKNNYVIKLNAKREFCHRKNYK